MDYILSMLELNFRTGVAILGRVGSIGQRDAVLATERSVEGLVIVLALELQPNVEGIHSWKGRRI